MKTRSIFTTSKSTALIGALILSQSVNADNPLEGQLIEDVTFDCRGSINYLIKPNSDNPAFVGHVQTFIDLPESAGGGSWTLSGVVWLGNDRGDNAKVKQQTAKINRCFGRGSLQVGACSTFSGVNSCQMQLDSNTYRMRIDRGSKGFIAFGNESGTGLFSTSSMGTEFIAFGTETGL